MSSVGPVVDDEYAVFENRVDEFRFTPLEIHEIDVVGVECLSEVSTHLKEGVIVPGGSRLDAVEQNCNVEITA